MYVKVLTFPLWDSLHTQVLAAVLVRISARKCRRTIREMKSLVIQTKANFDTSVFWKFQRIKQNNFKNSSNSLPCNDEQAGS